MTHQPVLLDEVIEYLAIKPGGIYIDGTFGRGGHSNTILKKLGPTGQLLAIDKDPEAIQAAKNSGLQQDSRFSIEQGSFTNLHAIAQRLGWLAKVDGILLDLGVSSPQLDDANRGFSFLKDGPLDMRMDTAQTLDATCWVNHASQSDIAVALKEYGEERYASRIAGAIINARGKRPITTTGQLAEIVATAHPKWEKHKHPATRAFQAIRIVVNQELDELKKALEHSLATLSTGGRLLVITFHSLEDRIVKDFISTHASNAHLPRELPLTEQQLQSGRRLKRITSGVKPSEKEITANPRARSATLRIMEKLS